MSDFQEQQSHAAEFDYCERCGEAAAGKHRVMFYHSIFKLPQNEFYCFRCLKVMRIYAVIGFTLLAIVIAGLSIATFILVKGS